MRLSWLLVLGLSLCGCNAREDARRLPPPQESGTLVVAIRNGPTSFYVDAQNNYAGIEYELLTRLAEQMRLRLEFVVVDDAEQALTKLKAGRVHLAALDVPLGIHAAGTRSVIYQSLSPVIVVNGDRFKPKTLSDFAGKLIYVLKDSAYSDRARSLQHQFPKLRFKEVGGQDMEELLEYVSLGQADAVITGSLKWSLARQMYPNLQIGAYMKPAAELAWQMAPNLGPVLEAQLRLFFQRLTYDGTLERLRDRYYGHLNRLQRPDIEGFLKRRARVLPALMPLFQQAEMRTGIDWRLLAAVAYQESHWDSQAVSPAGARGLMMLTGDIADHLRVENRLDPKQSIRAGADYLQFLKDQLAADIGEPDRTWLALAAYNVGLGHLLDARDLARRLNKDDDSWFGIQEALLLLREPKYYRTVKRGYARGSETVRYIESVRTYYDMLVRLEDQHIPLFPAVDGRILITNPEQSRLELDGSYSSDGRQSLMKRAAIASGIAVSAAKEPPILSE